MLEVLVVAYPLHRVIKGVTDYAKVFDSQINVL
jgi:hypothetical protein